MTTLYAHPNKSRFQGGALFAPGVPFPIEEGQMPPDGAYNFETGEVFHRPPVAVTPDLPPGITIQMLLESYLKVLTAQQQPAPAPVATAPAVAKPEPDKGKGKDKDDPRPSDKNL